MKYPCFIVDDDFRAGNLLTAFIEKTPHLTLQGNYTAPLEALAVLQHAAPGAIVFLDVNMPELSGIGLARLLGARHLIIFTTAHRDYGPEAYEQNARDYLLKPFTYERFLQSVQKTVKTAAALPARDTLFIKAGNPPGLTQITIPDITYIEGMSNYVSVYLTTAKIITYSSLSGLLAELPEGDFCRIHKSYIVNLRYIDRITTADVILKNGTELPVSRSFQSALQEKISPLILGEGKPR